MKTLMMIKNKFNKVLVQTYGIRAVLNAMKITYHK